MEVIVLQHIKIEDPGYIKDLMLNDGVNLTTIELDEGEKIPDDLNKFDAMFCMGGPMDTWMEDQYPWLIDEKKVIKEFVVNLKKPYLGFCLGCQLLGEVIGGKVVKSKKSEIGILNINFLKEKENDVLFTFTIAVADLRCTIFTNLSINNIGSLCGNKLSIFFLSIESLFIIFFFV